MTWDGTRDDSGWIDLTPTAAGGTGTCRYKTLNGGRLVELSMATSGASIPAGPSSPTEVIAPADFPAAIRPTTAAAYGRGVTTGNTGIDIIINPSGSVAVANPGASTATAVRCSVVYMVG
jgi:hypothetical protein